MSSSTMPRQLERTPALRPVAPGVAEEPDRLRALETEVGQLRTAMASRAVIEQAKGAIAVVRQVTPDDAFGVLRTVSQDTNVKLREVAARTLREFGALLG